jgi:nucleotide-binding universal stress UspA family protein
MQLKAILVATDLSPASEPALRAAGRLRDASGAQLYVLHVDAFELPAYFGADQAARLLHELRSARRDAVKQVTERVRDSLPGRFETIVVEGSPAETILRVADDLAANLIVIGTHGRRGLSRLMMGSVAERVMNTSGRPVIAVRERTYELARAPDELARTIANILLEERTS